MLKITYTLWIKSGGIPKCSIRVRMEQSEKSCVQYNIQMSIHMFLCVVVLTALCAHNLYENFNYPWHRSWWASVEIIGRTRTRNRDHDFACACTFNSLRFNDQTLYPSIYLLYPSGYYFDVNYWFRVCRFLVGV